MTASVGKQLASRRADIDTSAAKRQIYDSISRLTDWLERNDYSGYDTFDGLNSRLLRPLTFNSKFLRTALQQGVRRFPLNIRPMIGVSKSRSTKGMGFIARGFMRLHQSTGADDWRQKAEYALRWLTNHQAPGYSGAAWANHFDYQSRSSFVPKGLPSVVWTSLIGHAYLDAYEQYRKPEYLRVAESACEHIRHDLGQFADGDSICIGYFPTQTLRVHNANTLAGGFLARVYGLTREESYFELATKSLQYAAKYQRPDYSWYYGEKENLHWIDNFHTAYVLDSFKHYIDATADQRFLTTMMNGYGYWKKIFFLPDGTPRYYDCKTLPIDIQCCSQAVDTLVFFQDRDPDSLSLACAVAKWTIDHMQDRSGYFYYRRYSSWLVNRTPTLHWGQATMLCALAGLYQRL